MICLSEKNVCVITRLMLNAARILSFVHQSLHSSSVITNFADSPWQDDMEDEDGK